MPDLRARHVETPNVPASIALDRGALRRKPEQDSVTGLDDAYDEAGVVTLTRGTILVVDDDQLVLQVPADGSVDALRQMLDELHAAGIDVEHLSIHTPDLDDVFLAVTGSPAGKE